MFDKIEKRVTKNLFYDSRLNKFGAAGKERWDSSPTKQITGTYIYIGYNYFQYMMVIIITDNFYHIYYS